MARGEHNNACYKYLHHQFCCVVNKQKSTTIDEGESWKAEEEEAAEGGAVKGGGRGRDGVDDDAKNNKVQHLSRKYDSQDNSGDSRLGGKDKDKDTAEQGQEQQ